MCDSFLAFAEPISGEFPISDVGGYEFCAVPWAGMARGRAGKGCPAHDVPDDQRVKDVKLRKGWNSIFFEVSQFAGGWAVMARIVDDNAAPSRA